MLTLHRGEKMVISVFVVLTLVISVSAFAINNNMAVSDTYADTEETYTMPSGFTDQVFYNCVVKSFKNKFEGEEIPATGLTDEQLAKIESLNCGKRNDEVIHNIKGVEKLTKLARLVLYDNDISEIDVSRNSLLEVLDVSGNENVSDINVSADAPLETLYADGCGLEEIDVSAYTALRKLDVSRNNLTSLDLTSNQELTTLWGVSNELTEIIFPENSELKAVFLYGNKLESIALDNLADLRWITLADNKLTELSVDKNTELVGLILGWGGRITHNGSGGDSNSAGNLLTSIDVSKNGKLKYLNVGNNNIDGTVDVSNNPELIELVINNNKITSLDVASNPKLENIIVNTNQLTSLDLTENPLLETLVIAGNSIPEIDLSKNTELNTLVVNSDVLVDLDLKSIYEDRNVFDLNDVGFLRDGERSVSVVSYDGNASGLGGGKSSGGYTLGNLSFDIIDTDDYSYDKENSFLTIINPEAIGESVSVVERGTQEFWLKLPEMKIVDDDTTDVQDDNTPDVQDDEDISAISQDKENVAAPDTGRNSVFEGGSISMTISCGATILFGMLAIVGMVIRRRKGERYEIEVS